MSKLSSLCACLLVRPGLDYGKGLIQIDLQDPVAADRLRRRTQLAYPPPSLFVQGADRATDDPPFRQLFLAAAVTQAPDCGDFWVPERIASGIMVDRDTFDRIKQRHGAYASWAVWADATDRPKSHIGDLHVLDPDQNPTLLQILRNDVIMLGLNISRPGIVVEPFRNFHDASSKGQDYKIRYAFAGTPYYGAYMSDFIKDVVMLDRTSLMRHVKEHPHVVQQSVGKLLAEFNDLECDRPTVLTFGTDAHRLVANNVPSNAYSRLIPIRHYSDYISQAEYRQAVLKQIGSIS